MTSAHICLHLTTQQYLLVKHAVDRWRMHHGYVDAFVLELRGDADGKLRQESFSGSVPAIAKEMQKFSFSCRDAGGAVNLLKPRESSLKWNIHGRKGTWHQRGGGRGEDYTSALARGSHAGYIVVCQVDRCRCIAVIVGKLSLNVGIGKKSCFYVSGVRKNNLLARTGWDASKGLRLHVKVVNVIQAMGDEAGKKTSWQTKQQQ